MTGAAPLCLTQGDPSGIGPDLALTLYASGVALPPFFVLADLELLRRRAALLGLDVAIAECAPEQAGAMFPRALPVVPLLHHARGVPGAPDPADAPATVEAIERAVEFLSAGRARAMVTNPIAKSVLYASGFAHPGHTEFLGQLAEAKFGETCRPVMMIWSRELAVVPATIHIPLSAVASALRENDLVEIGGIVAAALARDFGIVAPRLAFCGLNPHAGEDGAMGREDIDIVAPAVRKLVAQGIAATGPLPADTLFHAQARTSYDAVVGMYHDQVLIPAKTLAFDTGVNVTLGLPFIRTSPDHGTAFALAGTGRARTSSLAEAIFLADRMARRRA
ncbi:4-hydroxythreonine-4-phosphate dehydrogenase PdxA [Rhodoblastus sphagnicola]|uniref:4-hydroxythreonine-4-phosphate dehydrogenase n=1 Tax=Rhodoblastus sphagnicola TaxID=333368 RepID=A0A2S6NCY1_9HYPH|nr:4-hydroxythreonine-4-phosphate dehydrogenase PdxA [Rhodoblastus sphagnicola]MBB4196328.1 4-hydroxythreonine-4-phosphate dehydrogenase [Rhodoblastus sphagnicola]PPQ32467.1 4-hydroxythreonine-4-phosphate dehydrogenase PdxA [Rhodoblastus sphagnicola]